MPRPTRTDVAQADDRLPARANLDKHKEKHDEKAFQRNEDSAERGLGRSGVERSGGTARPRTRPQGPTSWPHENDDQKRQLNETHEEHCPRESRQGLASVSIMYACRLHPMARRALDVKDRRHTENYCHHDEHSLAARRKRRRHGTRPGQNALRFRASRSRAR